MNPKWMVGMAALAGLALAGPTTADAQGVYQRSRDFRYEAYSGRAGFDNGYDDGLHQGRHDGKHRDRFDPRRDGRYRDGDHGYRSSFGPRFEYVRAYRQGFEKGYREGYSGYAPRDRSGAYGRDGYYDRR